MVSVNPSKRTMAKVGAGCLRSSCISYEREGAVVGVGEYLMRRMVTFAALAAGIMPAMLSSVVVIFVQVVPLVLHCIPGATPVITSLTKSIAKPVGASEGPMGTCTTLTLDIAAVVVAAVLMCTVTAS